MLAFNRPRRDIYVDCQPDCEPGCAADCDDTIGVGLDYAVHFRGDQTIPRNVKYKKECAAKDPANCPYHGTGKYAKAPMDLTNLKAYLNAIFVENHYRVPKLDVKVTDPKKGRVFIKLPYNSPRDKWTMFNFLKANFNRNSKGITQQDLFAFDRTSQTMSCNIKVRGFVTAGKGEKDIEKADKNRKGTVKKPTGGKQAAAKPVPAKKPVQGAKKPNAAVPAKKGAVVRKPANKPAPRRASASKPKPGSAKARVVAALQRAKARKVFARVKALRAAKLGKAKQLKKPAKPVRKNARG